MPSTLSFNFHAEQGNIFGGFIIVSLQIEIDDYKAIDFNIFLLPFFGGGSNSPMGTILMVIFISRPVFGQYQDLIVCSGFCVSVLYEIKSG